MIDIAMPDINGYNDYLLMKFVEKCDYQQDFLDGKLFFNTLDFFAMCDDCGRGDDFEGNTFIIDCEKPNLISANLEKVGGEYAIVVKDFSNNPHEYKKGTVWAYSDAIAVFAIQNRKTFYLQRTLFLLGFHLRIQI